MYDMETCGLKGRLISQQNMKFQINFMYLFNTQHIISHNLASPATHVQHSSKNDVSCFDGGLFLSSWQIYEHEALVHQNI